MKKLNKQLNITIIIIFSLIFICACEKGSYTIKDGKIEVDGDSYFGKYQNFDGYIEYSLGKKKILKLDYSIKTKSGSIKIYILNENREELRLLEKDKGKITIDEGDPINYILRIEGINHKGHYKIRLNK